MKVDELRNFGFEEKWIEKIKSRKIEEFYPPQKEFVERKLFEKKLCNLNSNSFWKNFDGNASDYKNVGEKEESSVYVSFSCLSV